MTRFLATILTVFLLGALPVRAQIANTDVLANYNFETIRPVLTELGFSLSNQTLDNGTRYLRAQSSDGGVLLLEPRGCNANNGCAGLYILALITGPSNLERANKFNDQVPYSKAIHIDDGRSVLSRYLIADYGTTAGSFAVNILVFKRSIGEWLEFDRSGISNTISYSGDDSTARRPGKNEAALTAIDDALPFYLAAGEADASLANGLDLSDLLSTGQVHEAAKDLFPALID